MDTTSKRFDQAFDSCTEIAKCRITDLITTIRKNGITGVYCESGEVDLMLEKRRDSKLSKFKFGDFCVCALAVSVVYLMC